MASDNDTISCDTNTDIDRIRNKHLTDERSEHSHTTRTLRNGKRVNTGQPLLHTSATHTHTTANNVKFELDSSENVFAMNASFGGNNANNDTTINRINAKTLAKSHYAKSTHHPSLDHDSHSDREFVAEEIIDKKKAYHWKEKTGIWLYNVKWRSFNGHKMTWETEGHCEIMCPDLVRQFDEKWSKTHISDDNTHRSERKKKVSLKQKRTKKLRISSGVTLNKSPNGEFMCDLIDCGFKTKYEFSIIRHKRKHKIQCDWSDCRYKAPNMFGLRRHKLIHTGEKPHKCEWHSCDASFRQRSHLNKHLLWHTKCNLNTN